MPRIRRERLAVSLKDLDRIEPALRARLLGDKLDLSRAEKVGNEAGIIFTCDLLTAAVVCDILRGHDREAGDYPTGIYLKQTTGWLRMAPGIVFTLADDKGLRLNPEVFPIQVDPSPLPPKVVKI